MEWEETKKYVINKLDLIYQINITPVGMREE